ncbi:hypothetical protein QC762_116925 [Podospora pseudocomata]|uniref:Uncharacterized protein n=1 Tax=Podospora pseudocomata TaxID=2093779 RepID=A0ABR0GWR0_9PEZI|nr:hypothetical protein QC762_116925 [Podospora pseudocomata]
MDGGFDTYRDYLCNVFKNANRPAKDNHTHGTILPTPSTIVSTHSTDTSRPINNSPHRYENSRIPVGLETFNGLTYVPPDVVRAISTDLTTPFWGPGYDGLDSQQPARIPFSWFQKEHPQAKFAFGFKKEDGRREVVRIEVPVTDLTYVVSETGKSELCALGIVGTDERNAALGTGVMKNGYWVLDASEMKVRVARGVNCGSEILQWEEGKRYEGRCGEGRTVCGGLRKKNGAKDGYDGVYHE